MRKLDKKAKKGGKARKPKRQAERVLGRKEDFAPTGIQGDVVKSFIARSAGGAALFPAQVYGAYYRLAEDWADARTLEEHPGSGIDPAVLEWRFLFDSVSAFAGEKALPELAEAVRAAVLCAFGCVESSGMTVAGLFRRLADTMPEYLTEEFRNPRWEARADKVAEAVMAKADPAFAEAYEGLRAMTAPYAGMSASSRLFEAQDAAVPGLPDFVPADVPGRRRHFNQAVNECWQRMKRCLEESRAFADLLRQELHHELSLVTIPVQGLLSTDELRQSQWGRDTLAWFLREARADADALAAAFEQDYAQGGRRFAAYFVHRRRVDRMLDALKAMGAAGCFYWRLLDGVCLRMDACGAMPKAGEARPCPFGSAAGDGGAGEDGKAVEDAARP